MFLFISFCFIHSSLFFSILYNDENNPHRSTFFAFCFTIKKENVNLDKSMNLISSMRSMHAFENKRSRVRISTLYLFDIAHEITSISDKLFVIEGISNQAKNGRRI